MSTDEELQILTYHSILWTARTSNQSILKEINPEYSLEGLMLKLKLQYFGHLMQRANSLEKALMLRKIEGRGRSGWQRMRWLDGIINPTDMSLSKLGDSEGQGSLGCCSPWGHKEADVTEQWTTATYPGHWQGRSNSPVVLKLLERMMLLWVCEKWAADKAKEV